MGLNKSPGSACCRHFGSAAEEEECQQCISIQMGKQHIIKILNLCQGKKTFIIIKTAMLINGWSVEPINKQLVNPHIEVLVFRDC